MGSQQLAVYEGPPVRRPAFLQGSSGMASPAQGGRFQVAFVRGAPVERTPLPDSAAAHGMRMAAGHEADLDPLDPRFLARIHDPHQR